MSLEQIKRKSLRGFIPSAIHGLDHSLEAQQASSNTDATSVNSLPPLSLPLEAISEKPIFYGEDVNETPNAGHQLH